MLCNPADVFVHRSLVFPSVLQHCWMCRMKDIQPAKTCLKSSLPEQVETEGKKTMTNWLTQIHPKQPINTLWRAITAFYHDIR